jgi:GTP-binding protein HflX
MLSASSTKNPTDDSPRDARGLISTAAQTERALLAQLILSEKPLPEGAPPHTDDASSLDELAGLVEAAGAEVALAVTQKLPRPNASTLFGKGKVEEIARLCRELDANVVIIDSELSPAQGRNLESAIERRVIDRTELILDIFARRAQTRQAKLQVELAQLRYQLPRLKRLWTHLDSQTGGGVGLRGPGETQLETDKRLAGTRIALLEKQLDEVRRQKHVESVGRSEFETGALVGYTNVGKSALLNALSRPTGKTVYEANQLFATLGASTRRVDLGKGREVLLSDTVGFVRRLPHNLVECFHSTLAEVENAEFLLLVCDAADPELDDKMSAVERVLSELNVAHTPRLLVLNQCDRLSEIERAALLHRFPDAIETSALTGEGLTELKRRMIEVLERGDKEIELTIPAGEAGKRLAELARHGRILAQDWSTRETSGASSVRVRARLHPRWFKALHIRQGDLKTGRQGEGAT